MPMQREGDNENRAGMPGIGIVLFPFSWRFGPWDRDKKFLFAIGPLRLVIYKRPGEWREDV